MSTALTLRVNVTSTDTAYADMESGDDFYIDIDASDVLICSEGSATVADGETIPSEQELNRAATVISAISAVEVAKYFLADDSDGLLHEIFNAGKVAKRYVFCASFDGATASEPTLEAWDDLNADSYTSACLGSGTPSASWYKAICTTGLTPSTNWSGISLAGSGASNVVELNDGAGALTTAKDLYFNFAIVIPAGITTPAAETPILMVTYTTN